MAPRSQGKVALDNVHAFNIAVTEYKIKTCEKTLAEIEKILTVLSKITDFSSVTSSGSDLLRLLINCHYLVSSLDHKNNTVWSVVSLLTNISSYDRNVSVLLRDQVIILPVLARLLHSLPVTSQARTLKLLQVLRMIVTGVRITRREAWLSSFIADLVSHLSSSELSSPSLYILCCLCQGNYIASKMVMASLTPDTLVSMFSTPATSSCDQLAAEILLHSLTSLQLSPLPQSQDKIHSYLPKLLDVFCSSYSSDDVSMMSLIVSFLSSLSSDNHHRDILAQQDCLSHLQQLIVIADFSEGFCLNSATLLFTFMNVLVDTYNCDYVNMFDHCLKIVLARLDSKPVTHLATALSLLTSLFNKMDFTSMSDATVRNLKFQVDQLLPSLLGMFVDISKVASSGSASKLASSKQNKTTKTEMDKDSINSCVECLLLLQTIAEVGIEGWTKTVAVGVKASKMVLAFKTISDQTKNLTEKSKLTVEMMTLSSVLAEADSSWRNVETDLVNDKDRVKLVVDMIKMENVEGIILKKALVLLNNIEMPEEIFEESKTEYDKDQSKLMDENEITVEQMTNIENLIENVENAVEKLDLDDVVCDVLQLADVRRGHERRQISHLIGALSAADERLANQNLALLERDDQVRRLERMVSGLMSKFAASKEELRDIRAQHGDLSREADQTRDRLARELEDARVNVETLTGERDGLSEKVIKYKGQVVNLTQDLEQYKDNQEQLEKRLKQEIKVKEEVSITLGKREEKLKKKERQLDEEMTTREKLEKECDDLRKQCSSLETLSKRQEQAISKKEKQLQEQTEEIQEMKKIQDAIFNLSNKSRGQSTSGAC